MDIIVSDFMATSTNTNNLYIEILLTFNKLLFESINQAVLLVFLCISMIYFIVNQFHKLLLNI